MATERLRKGHGAFISQKAAAWHDVYSELGLLAGSESTDSDPLLLDHLDRVTRGFGGTQLVSLRELLRAAKRMKGS